MISLLTRYRSLVDDVDQFAAALTRPLPTCIWANPLKTNAASLQSYLAQQGIDLQPIPWMPGAFRSHSWKQPGRTLAFVAGWYLVQEEIAMTAIAALDPQPGERVLDLCAAPGNKTVHIASRLAGSGLVIANEWKTGRLASLWSAISRMGLLNVLTLNADGRQLSLPLQFDRVLIDVPCSAEGTSRKKLHRSGSDADIASALAQLVPVQRALLDRALALVKPGGVVVYSTCTFSPEENEAVLDAVVGDRGTIEAFDIPGLTAAPGVTTWAGQTFRADVSRAHRYFPHLNDTGGFFVARIRRHSDMNNHSHQPLRGDRDDRQPWPAAAPQWAAPSSLQWMCDRFGLSPDALPTQHLLEKGRDKMWWVDLPDSGDFAFDLASTLTSISTHTGVDPEIERAIATVPFQNLGLPLVRKSRSGQLKPTTTALQRLGSQIRRNAVTLEEPDQIDAYVAGHSQPLSLGSIPADVDDGYVHVRAGAFELGCGLLRQGTLHSQFPKALRLC